LTGIPRQYTATISSVDWNHNSHYHAALLREVPPGCGRALDVGCGDGAFARKLASLAGRVDAIDSDAATIGRARDQTPVFPNVNFIRGDFVAYPVDADAYDFVSALASLHHLPFEPALEKMTRALRQGGVLAVLGIWPVITTRDKIVSSAAVIANLGYRLRRGPDRVTAPKALPTMTLDAIRARAPELLAGARVRRRLLWRYTIIWSKPG
jgi:SAM-dependent methyltransferase